MAKKQKLKPVTESEKTLAFAGMVLTVLAVVSSIYYWYVNQRFVHDVFPSLIYYISYVVVMGGGFVFGYLVTRRAPLTNRLLAGSTYALLTMAIYTLTLALNFIATSMLGTLPYPWGGVLFNGAPLLALVITVVVGLLLQLRRKGTALDPVPRRTFIGLFVIAQLYNIGNTAYWTLIAPGIEPSQDPLFLTIASYVLNPLTVMVIAYLLFNRVKTRTNRLFYAAFVGAFSETLTYSLWNFRTDPSSDATNVFSTFVAIIVAVTVGLLLLKVRRKS